MPDFPEITLDSFEPEVLLAEGPVLVYYYATWCKPCQDMEADLIAVAEEVGEKVKVVRINTDRQEEITDRQGVRTIPTLQVMQYGKQLARIRGKASKLELMGKLSEAVADSESEGGAADE